MKSKTMNEARARIALAAVDEEILRLQESIEALQRVRALALRIIVTERSKKRPKDAEEAVA